MSLFNFVDLDPPQDRFLEDVWQGLSRKPKTLPPKYLYDSSGSQLFERICQLEEYYLTKTEIEILARHHKDIEDLLEPDTSLIEYGSGSSVKIRKLLDDNPKISAYVPIDISKQQLVSAAREIAHSYQNLDVIAVCADYTTMIRFPDFGKIMDRNPAIFFPGSTLGNLDESEARTLLQGCRQLLGDRGRLILGIDLVKDPAVLERAYSDKKGVTAAFNKNILIRINRELSGNFDLHNFSHVARFNDRFQRIEMHLIAARPQEVTIHGRSFHFAKGESIHTESSYKYDLKRFEQFILSCGFELSAAFTDPRRYFAVCALKACPAVNIKTA
jgi:dimethylhistidine N-methyltransferase